MSLIPSAQDDILGDACGWAGAGASGGVRPWAAAMPVAALREPPHPDGRPRRRVGRRPAARHGRHHDGLPRTARSKSPLLPIKLTLIENHIETFVFAYSLS